MRRAKEVGKEGKLFADVDLASLRRQFNKSAKFIGLAKDVNLYQLRHGGASHDLAANLRTRAEVMARGRWQTEASVRRYAKIGKIQALLADLGDDGHDYCALAIKNMERVLNQGGVARRPPRG